MHIMGKRTKTKGYKTGGLMSRAHDYALKRDLVFGKDKVTCIKFIYDYGFDPEFVEQLLHILDRRLESYIKKHGTASYIANQVRKDIVKGEAVLRAIRNAENHY